MGTEVKLKEVWMEEYKTCSCTFLAEKKSELPGYCEKHGNDYRHRISMVLTKEEEKKMKMGYAH